MQPFTTEQISLIEKFFDDLANSNHFDFSNTILPIVGAKSFMKVILAFHKDFICCQTMSSDNMTRATKKAFCHKLKSAAANIGAISLSRFCIACEQDLEHIDADISHVTKELKTVFSNIENGLEQLNFII